MVRTYIVLIVMALSWNFAIAEEVVIKIATIVPEGSIWVQTLRSLNKDIKKKTKGRVQFKIYAGGVAGSEKDTVKVIARHKLDGALFLQAGIDQLLPSANLLKLPYFYNNRQQWQNVHKNFVQDLEKALDKQNYVSFGWIDTGFAYLFSRPPVKDLKTFRNSKTWLYPQDPLIESCFRELKGQGVQIKTTAVLKALKEKEIDCVYASPYFLIALRWHGHVRYCLDMPIGNVTGGFIMTKSAYNSIPTKYRTKVAKLIRRSIKKLNRKLQKENAIAKKLLQGKYQIKFITPNSQWVKRAKELGQKIAVEQVDKLYSAKELDKVRQLLNE